MEKPSETFGAMVGALAERNPESSQYEWIQGAMLGLIDLLWEEVERLKRERAEKA
jgi:hypothetical protein